MKKFLLLLITLTSSANLISQSWSPLSTGLSGSFNFGNFFKIYNNQLIVGGNFENAGGNNSKCIASWDGSNWSPMNTGIEMLGLGISFYAKVRSLAVFNNTLFAGGSFNSAGGTPLNNLAKWNGTSWLPVTLNMHTPSYVYGGGIYSLLVFNNALYVAGTFDSIGGIAANNIAKYDGINWTALGNGITYTNPTSPIPFCNIRSLYSYNNELIVGGYFNQAGTIAANNIAKWNGTTWSTLGVGIPNSSSSPSVRSNVTSLCVYNSQLYVGNTTSGISKWNGTNWSAVGGGIPFNNGYDQVSSMCVYNNKLILAGYFNKPGNLNINNVAAWDGSNWYYVGGNGFGLGGLGIYTSNGLYVNPQNSNGMWIEGISGLIVYSSDLYATGAIWTTNPMQSPVINFNNICKFSGAISIGVKENSPSYLSTISPNPSKGEYTFEGFSEKYTIDIFDVTGRIIYSNYIDQNNNKVNLTGKYPGVYIYKILNKENVIKQGKLILE